MKFPLLLPLLLLWTVSGLQLENDAPHLDIRETQADLIHDLEGSGEQEEELALAEEVIPSDREEAEASGYHDTFEDEEATELDPAALDEDLQCPREEETVQVPAHAGCKTCCYLLVQTPKTFTEAQNVCKNCYRGNLVSIHSYSFNYGLWWSARRFNQAKVWIGAIMKGWFLWKRFRWTDGSRWNFAYWAPGQPRNGKGHCVALCIKGGQWRRTACKKRLPFICSI
ncbi:proteoglycan 3 [Diceros bicornis minor]|uniref:proteoglycan 3 n=1 Tax=Diceros bicornis minor TaxID=77932 RepID=UPI0026ECE25E|nr:proteoglycan 3 [Diceros bicornis minor]